MSVLSNLTLSLFDLVINIESRNNLRKISSDLHLHKNTNLWSLIKGMECLVLPIIHNTLKK